MKILNRSVCLISLTLLLVACGEVKTVRPGRGVAAEERGPVAKVYPRGDDPVEAPHGLWRGFDDSGVRRWELRHTRGNPAGAYREWDADGELFASWTYDWDGNLTGWLRWYDQGVDGFKYQLDPENLPDFDPIGRAAELKSWAKNQSKP